jgi:hypothetical protein
MSETETKFEIEVDDETTLRRDDTVEHAEHGPMHVDSIRVGPYHKTAELKSEIGPIGLELTDEDLQEQWGETLHSDPAELYDKGTRRVENNGISVENSNIEVSVKAEGTPGDDVEAVQMHAIDQIVRGLQAMRDEKPPSECEGAEFAIDWETVFEDEEEA